MGLTLQSDKSGEGKKSLLTEAEAELVRKQYPAECPDEDNTEGRLRWFQSQKEMYDLVLCGIQDAVVVTDYKGFVTFANPAAEGLFGIRQACFKGQQIFNYLSFDQGGKGGEVLSQNLLSGKCMCDERVVIRQSDGRERMTLLTVAPREKQGTLLRVIGLFRDVTELERKNRELEMAQLDLRQAKERLEELVRTDEKTGLLNESAFKEKLREYCALFRRKNEPLTLIYMDLKQFKPVNDRFGHEEGDRVIRFVASQLRKDLYDVDIKARLHGDEFAVLLGTAVTADLLHRIVLPKLAKALDFTTSLRDPETGQQEMVSLRCDIGAVVRIGSDIPEARRFLELADKAMYLTKRGSGERRFHVDEYQI